MLRICKALVPRRELFDNPVVIGSKRLVFMSAINSKNFKYKPIPPKFKETTAAELFGDHKGWKHVTAGGYLLLVIPVSTLLLGVWQIFRWRWKLGIIQEMESKIHANPVDFPFGDLESLKDMEYRKVKLTGIFDYSNELLLGPRSLFNYPPQGVGETSGGSGLLSSRGPAPNGYHIITPFHIDGHNMTIMVNRGWVGDRMNHKHRGPEGEVEIVGVVRKTEGRQPFMMKDGGRGLHFFRDIDSMAEKLKTSEVFIDLVSITGMDLSSARLLNLPVPGQTRVKIRNEHVSYFCTWFSLSGITSYMWYRRFVQKLPLR